MFNFLLSIGQLPGISLYEIFFGYVLLNWIVRLTFSRRYTPFTDESSISAAVLVPILDEETTVFRRAMSSIKSNHPEEILVVINGPRNQEIEKACREMQIDFDWIPEVGKRGAIAHGLKSVTSEIVVLVDSDTFWAPDTLQELLKPFGKAKVGGVTTRQSIQNANVNVWTRWAAWLEEIRNSYSFPAMSSVNKVGCLPGRTIAFRRQLLESFMPEFLEDQFLGLHLEVSDDRALTNYTLKAGYATVFQSTSRVSTLAQTDFAKLLRQQLRWARGSQYNTLRMLPWMLKNARLLAFLYLSDILIPVMIASLVVSWIFRPIIALDKFANLWLLPYEYVFGIVASVLGSVFILILTAVLLATLFFGARYFKALKNSPGQAAFLPVFVLINVFILVPIRLLGFWWMAYPSLWGTRDGQESQIGKNSSYLKHLPQIGLITVIVGLASLSIGVLA